MVSIRLHGGEFALPKVGDEWSFTCLCMAMLAWECRVCPEFANKVV